MSTEQSLDPQLIEKTKQQIRGLVSEIAQLSKSEVAPEEFHGEFLTRVVSALAAIGGAVWTTEDQGRLSLAYQINLQETKLRDKEEEQIRHGRLLRKVLTAGEGMLVPPHSGAGDEDEAANPTDFLLVLGPLKTDVDVVGVVEVFQRPGAGPNTQKGYLRFLLQMCDLAGDFFKTRKLRHFTDRQVMWTQLEDFTRTVHANLDPRDTAYTIANEGRRLIECDRVSVAINRGRKCRIEAVSGQDLFDKRSNTIRLLGQLATAVVAGGESVWYTGDTSDMAPQIEDAVQEYVDESHTKMVAVLPLERPKYVEEDEEPDKREDPEPPLGALIVEQIEDSRVPERMLQRVDVVRAHSAAALGNAIEHHRLFLMPLWRFLGKTRWVLKARTLPKTLAVAGAVLAVVLALVLVPADFQLQGKGSLEPVLRRNVFAGVDGVIEEIPPGVRHGAEVHQGQLLARLRNTDLEQAITRVEGERDLAIKRRDSLQRAISWGRGLSDADLAELHSKKAEVLKELLSLESQLKIYEQQKKELLITSPVDGQVITWDLYDRLINRPVQRGQELIRIADPEGPWQLEIQMPESRTGHIGKARNELIQRSRQIWRQNLPDAPEEKLNALIAGIDRDRLDTMSDEQFDKLPRDRLRELLGSDLDKHVGEMPRRRLRELLRETDDRLRVEYILATDPGTTRYGTVKQIAQSAEILGDEGNTVLIKVAIDAEQLKKELPRLRPGATVTAKIDCGTRSIGYVVFHDAIAFVQSRILFRFF